jgi:hypothetical protein
MSYDENGTTRMELAKRAAIAVLSTLVRGDEAAVVPLDDQPLDPADLTPTADLQSLAMRIDGLRSTAGIADVRQGLSRTSEIFKLQPSNNRREIYIISDRQAVTWEHVDESAVRQWNFDAEGAWLELRTSGRASAIARSAINSLRQMSSSVCRSLGPPPV